MESVLVIRLEVLSDHLLDSETADRWEVLSEQLLEATLVVRLDVLLDFGSADLRVTQLEPLLESALVKLLEVLSGIALDLSLDYHLECNSVNRSGLM
jgi:hypothetical protein